MKSGTGRSVFNPSGMNRVPSDSFSRWPLGVSCLRRSRSRGASRAITSFVGNVPRNANSNANDSKRGMAQARIPTAGRSRLADLTDLVAHELRHLQPGRLEQIPDGLRVVLDKGLLDQDVFGEPGFDLALDDLVDDLGGL